MKGPVVRLKIRVRLEDGSYPFLEPVFAANGKIKPLYALVEGAPKHHPEGCYYLRYLRDGKRLWESIGTDAHLAVAAKQRRDGIIAAESTGVSFVAPRAADQQLHLGAASSEPSKDQAVAAYLQETMQYKARRTYIAYKAALESFSKSCNKLYLSQIDRRDILNYVDFLRKKNNGRRTVANRVSYVLIFLRKQGFENVIHPSDLPKYTEKIVKAYSADQLEKLFAEANTEDLVLFHFFLGSGCRDNEVVHACWEDLNFDAKTYDVREKPDLGFDVKDHEERTIPLPDFLIELLREHHVRHPQSRLIFPGIKGWMDHHLIRRLKRLATQAGLNCRRCISKNKNRTRCADHPVCAEWELHRFRKTFATMHAEAGVRVHTIARWLGHADIQTTMTYLSGSEATSDRTREQVNATFAGFATIGVRSDLVVR